MASLMSKLTHLAKSPQGKKMVDQAKQLASDPKTRAKIDEARSKLMKRGGAGHDAPRGGAGAPADAHSTSGPTKPPAV